MKLTQKKFISLWLVAAMMVTLLAACTGSGTESGSVDNGGASTSTGSNNGGAQTSNEEPAKIRMFLRDYSKPVPDGDTMDIPMFKYLAEKTNTDLEIIFLPHNDYATNLQLRFASGDIPDVYYSGGLVDDPLVNNGRALVLDELLDQYGPNIKKVVTEDAWDTVRRDGKIVAIPRPAVPPNYRLLYIRKDWLDKLNLEVPKTSDELLHVLRAFRDGDPNGNGEQDEIPFSMREELAWADNIFGMWGLNLNGHLFHNDELVPAEAHPNMKEALKFFNTMYEEKLLDQDFLTNTRAVWEQKINSGLVGVWSHNTDLLASWTEQLTASLPDENPEVIMIATPVGTGYDGPVGRQKEPTARVLVISNQAENPEAIIKMLDWIASEEGQIYAELGVEGLSYTVENGNIVYDSMADDVFKSLRSFNLQVAPQLTHPTVLKAVFGEENAEKYQQTINTALQEGLPNYTSNHPSFESLSYRPRNTYFLEVAAKIIVGELEADAFDDAVRTWRTTQNGDAYIRDFTEWYNSNN